MYFTLTAVVLLALLFHVNQLAAVVTAPLHLTAAVYYNYLMWSLKERAIGGRKGWRERP